jgi:hypothetical protein
MLRSALVAAFVLLMFPLSATAEEQIPIKNASDLKGTWVGPFGAGPFGSTQLGTLRITIKENGSFAGEAASAGSGAFRSTGGGSFEPRADGTAAVSSIVGTGTWRLFDVNGKRVIRGEGVNRSSGQSTWGEYTRE